MNELIELLSNIPIFATFNDEDRQALAAIATERSYEAGEILFVEMSEGDEFFLIQEGEARVELALSRDGKRIVMGPGELIGEVSYVGEGQRSATVTAETDLKVFVWENVKLRLLCETNPQLGYRLALAIAQVLAARLRRWNERLLDQVNWGF